MASAGDVNGDGLAGLIVDVVDASQPYDYAGGACVVFGATAGFDPTLELSSLNGSNGFRIQGSATFQAASDSPAGHADLIRDLDGSDRIDLHAIDADTTLAADLTIAAAGDQTGFVNFVL